MGIRVKNGGAARVRIGRLLIYVMIISSGVNMRRDHPMEQTLKREREREREFWNVKKKKEKKKRSLEAEQAAASSLMKKRKNKSMKFFCGV